MDLSSIEQGPTKFRLIASEIDRIAKETPERVWAVVPKNYANLDEGFEDITFSQFAAAVDRAAWFLHDTLGPAEPGTFPTLAYCGPSDLRYYFFFVAAMKTGYKILLLLSAKYTPASLKHILEATECQFFLREKEIAIPSVEVSNLRFVEAPKERDLLSPSPVKPYRYEPHFPSALNDPAYVLHTSGSSGNHKPILKRQGNLALYSGIFDIPNSSDGQAPLLAIRAYGAGVFNAFPIAHGGGVESGLIISVYLHKNIVMVQNDPLSVQTLLAVVRHTRCRQALLTPYTCAELVKSPDKAEIYEHLETINYAGGPLPQEVGNELCKHVHLLSSYGQTEHNTPIMHTPLTEDWQYQHFTPEWSQFEFEPKDEYTYEAFVVKHPDLYHRYFQPVFWIFPDLDKWATNDLFTKHPTKQEHWKHAGRVDDVVLLNNAVNFYPAQYEQDTLKKNPLIKNAIFVGNGRRYLSLIVELQDPSLLKTDRTQVENRLQESLDELNKQSTIFTRLSLERVVFCEEGESLPRTAKGTFSRKQVEAVFKERLDQTNSMV